MIQHARLTLTTCLLACFPGMIGSATALELCPLFSSNAVLQREMPLAVWGWDEPRTRVTVAFAGQKVSAVADGTGKWSATLQPLKLSKQPQDLVVSAGTEKVVSEGILVGDVWLCSGQSNMEMTFQTKRLPCDMPDFVKPEAMPLVRHLKVNAVRTNKLPKETFENPQARFQPNQVRSWDACDAESYKDFTATGFFFAHTLSQQVDVPIGLLNITQGNSRIGQWVSPESMATVADKIPDKHPFRAVYSKTPCTNFNTQVSPAAGFAIKGAIWYQGEANGKEGDSYRWKLKALVDGWRKVWQQGEFPFYYVQLPSYNGKGSWAPIREAQHKAMALIPNTGMVVVTDAGDNEAEFPINLHPRNKQVVGQRLALWALARDYGKKDLVYSGPLFKAVDFKGSKAVVSFDHVGSGLIAAKKESGRSVEPPRPVADVVGFEIAGKDGQWVEAKSVINGDKVVVSADGLGKPVAVRYLQTMNTDHGTLYNKDGLPASPFTTVNW